MERRTGMPRTAGDMDGGGGGSKWTWLIAVLAIGAVVYILLAVFGIVPNPLGGAMPMVPPSP